MRSPMYPFVPYNGFGVDQYLDEDIFQSIRPSSAATSRCADDIHLALQANEQAILPSNTPPPSSSRIITISYLPHS